jgi:hypothetical protein
MLFCGINAPSNHFDAARVPGMRLLEAWLGSGPSASQTTARLSRRLKANVESCPPDLPQKLQNEIQYLYLGLI